MKNLILLCLIFNFQLYQAQIKLSTNEIIHFKAKKLHKKDSSEIFNIIEENLLKDIRTSDYMLENTADTFIFPDYFNLRLMYDFSLKHWDYTEYCENAFGVTALADTTFGYIFTFFRNYMFDRQLTPEELLLIENHIRSSMIERIFFTLRYELIVNNIDQESLFISAVSYEDGFFKLRLEIFTQD